MKYENSTFVVSGGSSGLGLATVLDLLSSNAAVIVLDIQPPPTGTTTGNGKTDCLQFIETDLSSLPSISTAVNECISLSQASSRPIRGIINCAGIGTAAKFVDRHSEPHSPDVWQLALDINLTGTFNLTRLLVAHIVKNCAPEEGDEDEERAVVIMVSSAAAFEGQPGQTAYSATKGALRSMTLPMARDLARYGIRVVTIAPGVFESAMTSAMSAKTRASLQGDGIVYPKRFGKPEEFARTVKWILECPYINGETIRLSGAGRLPGKL